MCCGIITAVEAFRMSDAFGVSCVKKNEYFVLCEREFLPVYQHAMSL